MDVDTNNTVIDTGALAKSSGKRIYHDKNAFGIEPLAVGNQNRQTSVIIHEIGYAYTLGHPDTRYNIIPSFTSSVIRHIASNSSPVSLQQHDINDMNGKYK